jgi:hypothetical protein
MTTRSTLDDALKRVFVDSIADDPPQELPAGRRRAVGVDGRRLQAAAVRPQAPRALRRARDVMRRHRPRLVTIGGRR